MANPPFIIVAIDGGAAAGKSSAARALSERFNLLYSDTGSYYRAVTAEMLRRRVAAADLPEVKRALSELRLETRVEGRSARMEIDSRLPGPEIRGAEVNDAVSHFAAIPELRAALLDYQRGQAGTARSHGFSGLVMEGRDIGSVIFPQAEFRFFLQADPAERERRRAREGQRDQVAERDRIDSSRKTAPLFRPDGAIDLDTTHLTLAEVVERLAAPISAKLSS